MSTETHDPTPPAPVVLPEPELPPPPPAATTPGTVPGTVPAGWEGIMQPGESILWRGRPIARPRVLRVALNMAFGVMFASFALFWMVMAAQGGGIFWMFGLGFFFVGAGLVAKPLLDERMRLRDTFFTLSDRAAYIARRHWLRGRLLDTYPIRPDMMISLWGDAVQGDVIFAKRVVSGENGTREEPIGFMDIEGAPEVFAQMTQARDALR